MTINEMIKDIVSKEGGYVNDPKDAGGPTKYGITLQTLSDYLHKVCTIEDVKNITIELASEIYKKEYYYLPKIDKLPELIQPIILDIAVNSGAKKAIKMLQEVLNTQGYMCGVPDGIIGNNTISTSFVAVKNLGGSLINLLVDRRILFYNSIVKNNPSQQKFLRGWLARADSFKVNRNLA